MTAHKRREPDSAGSQSLQQAKRGQQVDDKAHDKRAQVARRRFLVIACMAGWLRPERFAATIAREVAEEAA